MFINDVQKFLESEGGRGDSSPARGRTFHLFAKNGCPELLVEDAAAITESRFGPSWSAIPYLRLRPTVVTHP